ncbi:MarR family winged helix-turn-helix transcriptional regulator [Anaeromicrobium sediminis]|uniref:MarR family transcriptional regulator n=1 Tax=Anaeromicrobium sediminis TaxID=1478221 RepID=A0A267MFK4_9FIRM|nr:MarR family transcriptional regulator [Anaeromicrobium sediminis]PAB58364.1 MarR family transcriptional regulator [Anaeromicrobium sediminis]
MTENLLSCCLYFTANKLSRIITKMAEEEFVKTGVSPSYAFLLMTVYSNPGISPKEISKELHIAPSTITRFVDKLEVKGLVNREFKGKNSFIYLTQEGKELQVEIQKCWKSLYDRYSEILGYEDGDALTLLINEAAGKLETK